MLESRSGADIMPGSMVEALRRKDFAIIFDWFAVCFFWGAIVCILLTVASASLVKGFYEGVRITALATIFAGACTVCGWLLGLLFGIPRTLSRPAQAPTTTNQPSGSDPKTTASAVTSRVNTNLEDVSDWLTKTLVGVGLTQLYFVPHYMWQAAYKINASGFAWENSGQLLALVLFLYFAPGGFWLGYIGTRTILTKLFDSLEGPTPSQVEIALAPEALKLDVSGREITAAASPEVKAVDAALLSLPVTALSSPRQLGAWGAAKARARDYPSAAFALEQAMRADPTDAELKDALGKVYMAQSRNTEASAVLQTSTDSEAALLAALYDDSPEGVRRALEIGTRLLSRPDAEKNLNLHVWLACAYGQQHKHALAKNDKALAESARQNVIKEVEAAVRVDPSKAKSWLVSLWRPTLGSPDDDLASIPENDEALTKLLL